MKNFAKKNPFRTRSNALQKGFLFSFTNHQARIRLKMVEIPAVWGLFMIWMFLDPGMIQTGAFCGFSTLIILAYLWNRSMARNVTAKRKLKYAAFQVGDELTEEITVTNASLLPVIWAEFLDKSELPDYIVKGVRAIDPVSSQKWNVKTICKKRGLFQLGPWELLMGDPFGIFQTRQTYFDKQEILVFPALVSFPHIRLHHHGVHGTQKPLNLALAEKTIHTFSTRQYQPGDPLRHIHWKTSARQNQTFVKIFEPEASSRIWLLPDLSEDVHLGENENSSLEACITLCGSVAYYLLKNNLQAGLLGGTEKNVIIQPQTGHTNIWKILRCLSPLQLQGIDFLENALDQGKNLFKRNDLCILITPSLKPGLAKLISRNISGQNKQVLLLDTLEFGNQTTPQSQMERLSRFDIPTTMIKRSDMKIIPDLFGPRQIWDFKVLGTGRVVVRQSPRPFQENTP